jgi:hypothetical protein
MESRKTACLLSQAHHLKPPGTGLSVVRRDYSLAAASPGDRVRHRRPVRFTALALLYQRREHLRVSREPRFNHQAGFQIRPW